MGRNQVVFWEIVEFILISSSGIRNVFLQISVITVLRKKSDARF